MPPEVFFIPVSEPADVPDMQDRIGRLADAVGLAEIVGPDRIYMLKTHFGEPGNDTWLKPHNLVPLISRIQKAGSKVFVSDTNVLYVSSRSNAVDHLTVAYEHGFTHETLGCPVIIADGLIGENQSPVEVNLKHYRQVYIANDARCADGFVVTTNVTGHVLAGLAASIKNVGMGVCGRGGKRSQHCDIRPDVNDKCVACGTCVQWCPTGAITVDGHAVIDPDKCIGCGECYAVCRYGAIEFSWSTTSASLQEKLAEHCVGALKGKKGRSLYFNFLTSVTKNCNCTGHAEKPLIPPIGILASTDVVAVDQATVDLVNKAADTDLFAQMYPDWDYSVQLAYGEKIGLGSRKYNLTEVA